MVIRTPNAVIFDMDGTLIDNYSYHIEAWYVICKSIMHQYQKNTLLLTYMDNHEFVKILWF